MIFGMLVKAISVLSCQHKKFAHLVVSSKMLIMLNSPFLTSQHVSRRAMTEQNTEKKQVYMGSAGHV